MCKKEKVGEPIRLETASLVQAASESSILSGWLPEAQCRWMAQPFKTNIPEYLGSNLLGLKFFQNFLRDSSAM